jgi:uncharacterized protein
MSITMYQASVPVFLRGFDNLSAILDKGLAFAGEQGVDPEALVQARLIGDMGPLASQVQRASDTAKSCAARLAGVDNPSFEDNEASFPELHDRISRTVAFLQSIRPEQIDGTEDKEILLNTRREAFTFTGQDFLLRHSLPNFFFHVTTAYDILRHKGVPLGKMDYLRHG